MLLPPMIIQQSEALEWLQDDPRVLTNVTQAYSECISTIINPIMMDYRFLRNHHMVNLDFIENPIFILGIHHLSSVTVLAVLYVYPQYRGKGIGRFLIQHMQERILQWPEGSLKTLQVAVEAQQPDLGKLYSDNGFKTLGNAFKDDIGVSFIDYFWMPGLFELEQMDGGTKIIPTEAC